MRLTRCDREDNYDRKGYDRQDVIGRTEVQSTAAAEQVLGGRARRLGGIGGLKKKKNGERGRKKKEGGKKNEMGKKRKEGGKEGTKLKQRKNRRWTPSCCYVCHVVPCTCKTFPQLVRTGRLISLTSLLDG